jgi:hypothetical protein
MFRKPVLIFIACITVFLSCGVEEYYFLPQVPETNITNTLNTSSVIIIPSIPNNPYYYAVRYAIFYRIYASMNDFSSSSLPPATFSLINSNLLSDYNYLLPITNPANTSATTSANTFRSRNFFELEFKDTYISDMLPKTGGTLIINFPTSTVNYPTASFNSGAPIWLSRVKNQFTLKPDEFFYNNSDLRAENATNDINTDVARQSGALYTYVAMYIVAVGTHPENFTRIYSKPTFISVFKLPD